jgi:cytidylate kinase
MEVEEFHAKPRGHLGFASVLTIDGATGSGKSQLLRHLSQRYECETIELGLVVRTIAWLAAREQSTISGAVAGLAALSRDGKFALGVSPWGRLAACDVFVFGENRLAEILDPRLGPAVAATSLDRDAMCWVHAFVRELARDSFAIVSGRHAGSETCPTAGLKIRLEADWRIRKERKLSLYRREGTMLAAADDADLLVEPAFDQLSINTGVLNSEQLAQRVAELVEDRLGWRPRVADAPPPVLVDVA